MRQRYDLLGVGAGIFNLSLAALFADKKINSHFLDKNPSFEWYPGLMFNSAKMQTCCIAPSVRLPVASTELESRGGQQE